ncbi:MAG: hypothetical protein EOO05_22255 [Chitinophagaceae bacterium]|nr:MAG: hypothetical protein EOO05_22255 [Chitinophagaceae bacterium]
MGLRKPQKGIHYLELAAAQGSLTAMSNLGYWFSGQKSPRMTPDLIEALKWYYIQTVLESPHTNSTSRNVANQKNKMSPDQIEAAKFRASHWLDNNKINETHMD